VYLVGLKNTGRNNSGEGKQLADKGLFVCSCICLPAEALAQVGLFVELLKLFCACT
jgi:hypothetical protein